MKTRISAPAHPSATGIGRVSGLVALVFTSPLAFDLALTLALALALFLALALALTLALSLSFLVSSP